MIITSNTGVYRPPTFVYYKYGLRRNLIVTFEFVCYVDITLFILPIPGRINFVNSLRNSHKHFKDVFCEDYKSTTAHDCHTLIVNPSERHMDKIMKNFQIKKGSLDFYNVFNIMKQLKAMYPDWSFLVSSLLGNADKGSTRIIPIYISYHPFIATSGSIKLEVIPIISNVMDTSKICSGSIDTYQLISMPVNMFVEVVHPVNAKDNNMVINMNDYPDYLYKTIKEDISIFPTELNLVSINSEERLNGDCVIKSDLKRPNDYSITNRHFRKKIESESI